MNLIILMGRLTKDADIRQNGENKAARFTLAVDRRYTNKDGQKETDFISCVAFGKQAEFIEKYCSKGKKIIVTGEWRTGSYEKDGKKIYTNECFVNSAEFAESKNSETKESAPEGSDSDFMEVPKDMDMPF